MLSPYMRYRLGLGAGFGGLADFNALVGPGGSAEFTSAWNDVSAQLTLEGAVDVQGAAGAVGQVVDLSGAKVMMADAYNQISQSFGVQVSQAVDAAKQYVMMGQTIVGAVSTIDAMTVSSDQSAKAGFAFTGAMLGTLTSVAIAAGVVSAGLGAAIVAGFGAIVEVMNEAHLFGPPPPAGGTICGFPLNSKPDFTVGCLGMWGSQISPGSPNWRAFPDPKNSADAAWFRADVIGAGEWNGAFYGIRSPGGDQVDRGGAPNPAGPGGRPIDNAFPWYATYVESTLAGPPGFPEMLRAAWMANAAFLLNGLAAQPDWVVLAHCLRLYNRAHMGPAVLLDSHTPQGTAVQDAADKLGGDPLVAGKHALYINVGPKKTPPVASGTLSTSTILTPPTSTTKKVIVGAGATLAIAPIVYAYATGHAIDATFRHLWSGAQRLWGRVAGDVGRLGRRRNPLFAPRSSRRRRRR